MKIGKGIKNGETGAITIMVRIPFLQEVPVLLSPVANKQSENHPDMEMTMDGERCGAAWVKTPRAGGEKFLSGSIERTVFPGGRISVAVFKDERGGYEMVWSPDDGKRGGGNGGGAESGGGF